MKFKQWLEATPHTWGGATTQKQAWGQAAKAAGGVVADMAGAGIAANILDGVSAIMQIVRQNRGNPINDIIKMMDQPDMNNAPANALDLDDQMSQMLSPETKKEIAQKILAALQNVVHAQNAQNLDPKFADKIAGQHVKNILNQAGIA